MTVQKIHQPFGTTCEYFQVWFDPFNLKFGFAGCYHPQHLSWMMHCTVGNRPAWTPAARRLGPHGKPFTLDGANSYVHLYVFNRIYTSFILTTSRNSQEKINKQIDKENRPPKKLLKSLNRRGSPPRSKPIGPFSWHRLIKLLRQHVE